MAVKGKVPDYDDVPGVAEAEGGGEGWYPDLPRVKFEALLGKRIIIEEVDFRESTFQEGKQYVLIRFRPADKSVPGEYEDESIVVEAGEEATTSTGGVRVVDQLRRTEAFPAKATVAREKTKRGYHIWSLAGD